MFSSNNKASIRQLEALFLMNIFGTSIIIMPRIVTDAAMQNGWIIIIGGVLAAIVLSLLMNKMNSLFPGLSFMEFSKKTFTKPVGFVLSVLLSLRIIVLVGLEISIFKEVMKVYLLPNTPSEVVIIILLICAAYLSYHGFETRARISEILIFVVMIPLVIVLCMAIFGSDFTNLLPINIAENPISLKKWGWALCMILLNFRGLQEILLMYPFLTDTTKAKKGYTNTILLGGAFLLAIYIISIARFGTYDLLAQAWPLLSMMDTIEMPGSFVEKQNAFIMSFWIVSVFMIVAGGLYFAAHITQKNIGLKCFRPALIPAIIMAYIVSVLPKNEQQAFEWMLKADIASGLLFFLILPLITIFITKVRRSVK